MWVYQHQLSFLLMYLEPAHTLVHAYEQVDDRTNSKHVVENMPCVSKKVSQKFLCPLP